MYFPDLNLYTYLNQPPDPNLLTIGWLDNERDFQKGTISEKLLDKILELCFEPVSKTRGFHQSPFLPINLSGYAVTFKDKRMVLGSAEIRVKGKNGKTYAAPNLIYHYIKDCAYKPPQEFLEALEAL